MMYPEAVSDDENSWLESNGSGYEDVELPSLAAPATASTPREVLNRQSLSNAQSSNPLKYEVSRCFANRYYGVNQFPVISTVLRYNTTNKESELSVRGILLQGKNVNADSGNLLRCLWATVYFPPNSRPTRLKIMVCHRSAWTSTLFQTLEPTNEASRSFFIQLPEPTKNGENIWVVVCVHRADDSLIASLPICYKFFEEHHLFAKKLITNFEKDVVTLD